MKHILLFLLLWLLFSLDISAQNKITLNLGGSTVGAGGANTTLSNIASPAINTSLISDANNTDDLGSSALAWRNVFAYTAKLKGSTSGTATLQASATAGTVTITLPATTGTAALTSDLPNYGIASLGDAATITWDLADGITTAQTTLGGNRTLAFSNLGSAIHKTLYYIITQDGTGSRTLTLPSECKVVNGGGGAILLSTAPGSVDIVTLFVKSAGLVYVTYGTNFN